MPKFCVPHSQEHLAKSSLDVTSSPVKEWLSRFSRTLGADERNYGVQARSGILHRQLLFFVCVNRLNIHQVLNTSGNAFVLVVLPRKDRIQEVADIERVAREVQLLKLIRPEGCELGQCSLDLIGPMLKSPIVLVDNLGETWRNQVWPLPQLHADWPTLPDTSLCTIFWPCLVSH